MRLFIRGKLISYVCLETIIVIEKQWVINKKRGKFLM